jgi:hypothetical protein
LPCCCLLFCFQVIITAALLSPSSSWLDLSFQQSIFVLRHLEVYQRRLPDPYHLNITSVLSLHLTGLCISINSFISNTCGMQLTFGYSDNR